MISLKAVEYSFIVALTVLQCFREAIIECQQHPGAKFEGLVLASLDKKILDREETTTRVRFFGNIQIRILVSKNGFCVSLPKSENGLIRD